MYLLGGSVIVGPVKIGSNAVVAAGSVVVKDVAEGCIVGGNPARVIGRFDALKGKRDIEDKGKTSFNPEEQNRLQELWYEFVKGEDNVR